MAEQKTAPERKQSDAEGALAEWVKKTYKAASRTRYAEEREWATAGYFYQQKQWLDEDPQTNKLRPMSRKKDGKWPMPVTNLFSKTIDSNANALGADVPRMAAISDNYEGRNRRAAEAAEHVIDAANRESGMEIINPRLALGNVLWGVIAVYDTIAFDHSTVEVPEIGNQAVSAQSGQVAPGASQSNAVDVPSVTSQPDDNGEPAGKTGSGPQQQQQSQVGSEPESVAPQIAGVQTVPTARLQSYVLTPFEFYIKRSAQDPNLSEWRIIRWRKPLGLCKETWPDVEWQPDGDDGNLAQYYLNTLRSLSYQNSKANEEDNDLCTVTEIWTEWSEIPEEVQEKIVAEWQNEPSEIYADQGFTKLQAAVEYGCFVVFDSKWQVVQWAENPWEGDMQPTFFTWRKDFSVYSKGQAVELIPLTKKLNRIDSLIERNALSTATSKLLWPTTQTTPIPSGDPVEVVQWDPLGDGKVKPEILHGDFNSQLLNYRNTIVQDINNLGNVNSVAEGDIPEGAGGMAFRGLAYLGSKAEETRKTHRYLWEQAHELRARKIIKMARKVWTEPRKIQTAGFNNRYGSVELDVADLDGSYQVNVIQDSSKPKTMTEKLQAIQLAQTAGYINPTDVSTRDYVLEALGLQELDESDHLDFDKAERDLEKLKQGIEPQMCPFTKWEIPLVVFSNYTKTEEFEALPDNTRHGILAYAQWTSEMLQVAKGAQLGAPALPPPGPGQPGTAGPPSPPPGHGPAPKSGVGGQTASHVLGQVPGATVSAPQVEGAAIREAASVVPNSPSPTA